MSKLLLLHGPNAHERPSTPIQTDLWSQNQTVITAESLQTDDTHTNTHLVTAFSGEFYGHQNSNQTLLSFWNQHGPQILNVIDGCYSAVILNPSENTAITLIPPLGMHPLFIGYTQTELFITSDLKSIDKIDSFEALPTGCSQIDLTTGHVQSIALAPSLNTPPTKGSDALQKLLKAAVIKRLPSPNEPFGVFLSGGLDSSVIAAITSQLRNDVTYFTLGDPQSPDADMVAKLATTLGLKDVHYIPSPSPDRIPELIKAVVYATRSFNPSIISNGVATYLLAEAASQAGISIVLTGEGADELFGGYHNFQEQDPWQQVREQLIKDLWFTELRRLKYSCQPHNVIPRCPFLDRDVVQYSGLLTHSELYQNGQNKVALRQAFQTILPPEIVARRKTSLDVGSGLRRLVQQFLLQNGKSEREELRQIWHQAFSHDDSIPFFSHYPVFDHAIDRRGEAHR